MEKYVFKKYSSFVSNACLISSFSNLFYNCGLDIMESDIFFLGDGMRFDYQWNDNAKSLKDILLFHDSNIMIQNFFEQINEKISIKKIPCGVNEEEFNIFIKKKIDEGVPVIIAINTEYITYYNKIPSKFRPHFLTVIGYRDDEAYISDCLVPTVRNYETYVGFFGFSDLFKASRKMGHIYYDFNYEISVKKIKTIELNQIHYKFKKNIEIDLYDNYEKLKDFAYRIRNIKKQFPIEEIAKSAEDLFFNIKYNGILHSRMLVHTHMLKYHEENQGVLSKLKDIYIKWEAINYALLKNNLTNAPEDKYDGLCESVLNLLDLEYQTYKSMLACYTADKIL